jgi:phospholipase/carboxylesterase
VLSTFEIEPTAPQRGTVIWMHGLGASNHDFDSIVPELAAPYLRFVFPAAPVRPVTINGGMPMPAWYDILTFDDPPLREQESDVRHAEGELRALIQREHERGVTSDQIVLAGFSQGAAMALHLGLRTPETFALGKAAHERLEKAGYRARWAAFDMEHSLCLDEVREIASWLEERFARAAAG